jgi:hypothetical protein
LPTAEYALRALAAKPSRKSNIIAVRISHEAPVRFPLSAKIIEIKPAARLREVMKLGICFILILVVQEEVKIKINFSNKAILVKFGSTYNQHMIDFNGIKIAVDFDGTIVEHQYPEIGKEKLFAFQTLKELEKRGARIILWTFRTGKELEDAVNFCRQNGVEFYAVNKNYPEEVPDESISRKIDVDIYIDDKNLGGFPGWSEVWQMLYPFELQQKEAEKRLLSARKNIFRRLFTRRNKTDDK